MGSLLSSPCLGPALVSGRDRGPVSVHGHEAMRGFSFVFERTKVTHQGHQTLGQGRGRGRRLFGSSQECPVSRQSPSAPTVSCHCPHPFCLRASFSANGTFLSHFFFTFLSITVMPYICVGVQATDVQTQRKPVE